MVQKVEIEVPVGYKLVKSEVGSPYPYKFVLDDETVYSQEDWFKTVLDSAYEKKSYGNGISEWVSNSDSNIVVFTYKKAKKQFLVNFNVWSALYNVNELPYDEMREVIKSFAVKYLGIPEDTNCDMYQYALMEIMENSNKGGSHKNKKWLIDVLTDEYTTYVNEGVIYYTKGDVVMFKRSGDQMLVSDSLVDEVIDRFKLKTSEYKAIKLLIDYINDIWQVKILLLYRMSVDHRVFFDKYNNSYHLSVYPTVTNNDNIFDAIPCDNSKKVVDIITGGKKDDSVIESVDDDSVFYDKNNKTNEDTDVSEDKTNEMKAKFYKEQMIGMNNLLVDTYGEIGEKIKFTSTFKNGVLVTEKEDTNSEVVEETNKVIAEVDGVDYSYPISDSENVCLNKLIFEFKDAFSISNDEMFTFGDIRNYFNETDFNWILRALKDDNWTSRLGIITVLRDFQKCYFTIKDLENKTLSETEDKQLFKEKSYINRLVQNVVDNLSDFKQYCIFGKKSEKPVLTWKEGDDLEKLNEVMNSVDGLVIKPVNLEKLNNLFDSINNKSKVETVSKPFDAEKVKEFIDSVNKKAEENGFVDVAFVDDKFVTESSALNKELVTAIKGEDTNEEKLEKLSDDDKYVAEFYKDKKPLKFRDAAKKEEEFYVKQKEESDRGYFNWILRLGRK